MCFDQGFAKKSARKNSMNESLIAAIWKDFEKNLLFHNLWLSEKLTQSFDLNFKQLRITISLHLQQQPLFPRGISTNSVFSVPSNCKNTNQSKFQRDKRHKSSLGGVLSCSNGKNNCNRLNISQKLSQGDKQRIFLSHSTCCNHPTWSIVLQVRLSLI